MESTLAFTRANPWDPKSCDECTLTKNIFAPDDSVFSSTSENVDLKQCCDQGKKDHDFDLKAACSSSHSVDHKEQEKWDTKSKEGTKEKEMEGSPWEQESPWGLGSIGDLERLLNLHLGI